jgi:CelD/BcsL family acetyltransferase involved in cellulose biosynthesis
MSWRILPAANLAAHPEHAAHWRRLHGAGSPLLALEFAAAALEVFGSGAELLAMHLDQTGQPNVMAILQPARRGAWTTFQPSQAPIGFWLQRDAQLQPAQLQPAQLAALLRALPGAALLLGLTQCDPMLLERPADTPALTTLDYIRTARIELAGGFDAYWDARGKNLRANLKKQRNRLRQDGVATRLQISRAEAEMAAAVADYGRLESAGWKAAGGTAVAGENPQGRFYRLLLEAFARQGAASVYRYWIGERLAAMDLCIEGGGCLVVLKTAYDEELGASLGRQFSPALLMREEACRALFDEGRLASIEFYGRVMDWHLRWSDDIRTLYHLNAYRWPWLRRLHARSSA